MDVVQKHGVHALFVLESVRGSPTFRVKRSWHEQTSCARHEISCAAWPSQMTLHLLARAG